MTMLQIRKYGPALDVARHREESGELARRSPSRGDWDPLKVPGSMNRGQAGSFGPPPPTRIGPSPPPAQPKTLTSAVVRDIHSPVKMSRPKQLPLAKTGGWGGRRAGAGRKRLPGRRPSTPHRARP